MARNVLIAVLIMAAPIRAARTTVDIYFIDVEGGQSTLIVTPRGESLLVDTGFPGPGGGFEAVPGDPAKARDAQRILADEAARREAIFQQSVDSEKTRGDALAKRFEEALRQAREEPVTKPMRDFDLD